MTKAENVQLIELLKKKHKELCTKYPDYSDGEHCSISIGDGMDEICPSNFFGECIIELLISAIYQLGLGGDET